MIGTAEARNLAQPTCIPPSKRIAISATTAIRSTSTVESRPSPGQMSDATAAATRKSAGAGTGKSSVSLCAPTASENAPATSRTISPKSVSSLMARYSRTPWARTPCLPTCPSRRRMRARGPRAACLVRLRPAHDRRPPARGGRGGGGGGRHLRRRGPGPLPGRGSGAATSPASTRSTRSPARLDGLPDYRRWGFESAALDLALRQAGVSLHEVLGRGAAAGALRRLDRARRTDGAERLRASTGHALQARSRRATGTRPLVAELAELDCVDVRRLQGGVHVAGAASGRRRRALYRPRRRGAPGRADRGSGRRRSREGGDPRAAPRPDHLGRRRSIRSTDVDALPFPPRVLNSKPSRFGSAPPAARVLRLLRERGYPALRRRPVRARARPRPDPVPRLALPPRRRRTTSRRAGTTSPPSPPGLARARCDRRRDSDRFPLVAGIDGAGIRVTGSRAEVRPSAPGSATSGSGSGGGRRSQTPAAQTARRGHRPARARGRARARRDSDHRAGEAAVPSGRLRGRRSGSTSRRVPRAVPAARCAACT